MTISVAQHPANTGRGDDVWGRRKIHLFQVTLDSGSLAAGEVLGLSALGVKDPTHAMVFCTQAAPATAGYVFSYDLANDKLVTYWVDTSTDGAAMAPTPDAGANLSTVIVNLLVIEP